METKNVETVDLGLPSGRLWCKYLLGVDPNKLDKAEDWYGKYYAWAETTGYYNATSEKQFSWEDYEFGSEPPFSKYDTDGKKTLEPEDDAATVELGEGYRIPTKEDFQELISNTTNSWITNYKGISGLNGRLFQGNNQELFIPTDGCCGSGSRYGVGGSGCVWSSSLGEGGSDYAWRLGFGVGVVYVADNSRYFGLSVLPVKK